MRTLALLALGLAALAPAQFKSSTTTPIPEDLRPGVAAITIADAQKWLGFLAGPETKGRGSGQQGYIVAADWMAKRFAELGLKPAGENGTYFQDVPWIEGTLDRSTAFRIGDVSLEFAKQFWVSGAPSAGVTEAPLVFVQANGQVELSAADAAQLKGKLVVAQLTRVPRPFRRALARSGAAGVFEVSDVIPDRNEFRGFTSPGLGGRIHPDSLPAVLGAAGITPLTIEAGQVLLAQGKPGKVDVKGDVKIIGMPNVLGVLEGSDPALKHEFIGIGAHLDHLGYRMVDGQEVVYPGADDDGSGCTALLGVARAFQASPLKPKRSVLFLAFAGEEMGLVGSTYFVENPTMPLKDMVGLLQMDMVGRDSDGAQNGDPNRMDKAEENRDTMRLVGSKRHSTEWHQLVLDLNQHIGFRFKYDAEDVYTRSDHYVFAARGIPVCFTFCGFHPDYHRPTDTIEKINWDKLTNTARLNFMVAMRVANRETRFKIDVPQDGGLKR